MIVKPSNIFSKLRFGHNQKMIPNDFEIKLKVAETLTTKSLSDQ
jgi:hypothetical protein